MEFLIYIYIFYYYLSFLDFKWRSGSHSLEWFHTIWGTYWIGPLNPLWVLGLFLEKPQEVARIIHEILKVELTWFFFLKESL